MSGTYAEIIDGKVTRVLVKDGTPEEAIAWLKANVADTEWVETKEDGSTKGKYAGIGDEWHPDIDVFIRKPFKSWILDKDKKMYLPPLPRPIAVPLGQIWVWSEKLDKWVLERVKEIVE